MLRVANPAEAAGKTTGISFAERFDASYHNQIQAFATAVEAVAADPSVRASDHINIDADRSAFLDELIDACHVSVAGGGATISLRKGKADAVKLEVKVTTDSMLGAAAEQVGWAREARAAVR